MGADIRWCIKGGDVVKAYVLENSVDLIVFLVFSFLLSTLLSA